MLVLSRRLGEVIHIGPDITVTVVGVHPRTGAVRIGVVAPADVLVLRRELLDGETRTEKEKA